MAGMVQANAKEIHLVVDHRNWYPFTFSDRGASSGMHVDLVKKALSAIGYTVKIKEYPRKRCLLKVKDKEVDGMISIAFHEELSPILDFPPDSSVGLESDFRIMHVDHMVVTYDPEYRFSGDISTLPIPVRLPMGETSALNLMNKGLRIDFAKADENNFKKLLRDKTGCVISTSVSAENIIKQIEFRDQFTIQSTPILSQSYHLAFAKDKVSATEQQKIWKAIKKWRDDYVYALQMFSKY